MDPDVIIPLAGMLTGGVVIGTMGWTVRHWVNRYYDHKRGLQAGTDDGHATHIDERLAMLEEQVATRLMDLEERMDFTERVLTRGDHEPADGSTRR
jgi:phage terminase large subunit